MNYGIELVEAPAVLPISLAEAKTHLRVAHDDEDGLIYDLIATATEWFETETYRQLISATWDLYADRFPTGDEPIRIPRSPLQSVTSITYTDAAGDSQTLDSGAYVVQATRQPGVIRHAYATRWPTARDEPDAVVVRFVAGYGDDPDDVPPLARAAIKLIVGQLYEYREELVDRAAIQIPNGAKRIMRMMDLGDELLEYGSVRIRDSGYVER